MQVRKQVAELWHTIQSWFQPNVAPDWRLQAVHHPRCRVVVWLAEQVALDLLAHRPWGVSTEELVQAVDQSIASELQHDAERFIETHYFAYPCDDPQFYRILLIFRHCIQRKLRQPEKKPLRNPHGLVISGHQMNGRLHAISIDRSG